MKARFEVDVPDDFVAQRAARADEDTAGCGVETDPLVFFESICTGIADDELPLAFYGWPVTVTITVEAE